jgi:hypothetical protein
MLSGSALKVKLGRVVDQLITLLPQLWVEVELGWGYGLAVTMMMFQKFLLAPMGVLASDLWLAYDLCSRGTQTHSSTSLSTALSSSHVSSLSPVSSLYEWSSCTNVQMYNTGTPGARLAGPGLASEEVQRVNLLWPMRLQAWANHWPITVFEMCDQPTIQATHRRSLLALQAVGLRNMASTNGHFFWGPPSLP